MLEEDLEVAIKVVVVGNGAVGKSSMIQRYCKGIFTQDYKKTIGVDFLERQIDVDGEDVRLMLWDTAGQEEFDTITKAYYRGAQACVLAFSTIDRNSFEAIESWKHKVEEEIGEVVMVLVQNKIDLIDDAVMTAEEVEEIAKNLKLKKVFRTSVKENFNVEEVFKYLALKYIERRKKDQQQQLQHQKPSSTSLGIFRASTVDQTVATSNDNAASTPSSPTSTAASNGQAFKLKPVRPEKKKKKRPFCLLL